MALRRNFTILHTLLFYVSGDETLSYLALYRPYEPVGASVANCVERVGEGVSVRMGRVVEGRDEVVVPPGARETT
jgi:hypothetical protein